VGVELKPEEQEDMTGGQYGDEREVGLDVAEGESGSAGGVLWALRGAGMSPEIPTEWNACAGCLACRSPWMTEPSRRSPGLSPCRVAPDA
jgi:hypothetical protein